MHDNDVHEAVYLNCKICVSWARGSGPWAGPVWPNSENVLNLQKSSSLFSYIFEKIYMHDYDVHEAVTRPLYWYHHFLPHDLDRGV